MYLKKKKEKKKTKYLKEYALYFYSKFFHRKVLLIKLWEAHPRMKIKALLRY